MYIYICMYSDSISQPVDVYVDLLEWFLSSMSSDVKVKHSLSRCSVSTELADKWLHLVVNGLQTTQLDHSFIHLIKTPSIYLAHPELSLLMLKISNQWCVIMSRQFNNGAKLKTMTCLMAYAILETEMLTTR